MAACAQVFGDMGAHDLSAHGGQGQGPQGQGLTRLRTRGEPERLGADATTAAAEGLGGDDSKGAAGVGGLGMEYLLEHVVSS